MLPTNIGRHGLLCLFASPGEDKPIWAHSVTQSSSHLPRYVLTQFGAHRYIIAIFVIVYLWPFVMDHPVYHILETRHSVDIFSKSSYLTLENV